jgi:two-component system, chemotaxis family, sensor kinase CheA
MDPMEAIKQTYFQECDELLLAMEEGLIAMDNGETDDETINAVFRAVHSIKGGGGAFGFDQLVTFAHGFETVLDDIRSHKLEPVQDVRRVLLKAGDMLADFVGAVREGHTRPAGHADEIAAELARLAGDSHSADSESGDFEGIDFTPQIISFDDSPPSAPSPKSWHIRFVPHPALYAKANEPALILRELKRLGPAEIVCDHASLPDLAAVEPDQSYFAWDIVVHADVERGAIEDVFDFVMGDCDLDIDEIAAPATDDSTLPLPDVSALTTSEAPSEATSKVAPEVAPAVASQAASKTVSEPVATNASPAVQEAKAPATATEAKNANAAKATVRVDLEKVDRLVNLVGELVITQAMLNQQVHDSDIPANSPVSTGLAELDLLLRELQESVMAIRTQPVKSVFQRMPRLMRELAAQTNKEVRLVLEGESTEVDKTVVERLGEPLTHMIRNAVDHGLETAEDRIAAGKPAEGTVTLSARHHSGRIVIELSDDGRGIDRERVRAKAIEKGLIPANAVLSDEETDNLIFLPGFSTASQVSNISGRGVGMDVVRRSITELGGRVVISSNPGKGSRFSLSLPLTLAVLDGMVITVGDQTFVLPLTHIAESMRPKPDEIRPYGANNHLLRIRNAYVPFSDIGRLLGIERGVYEPSNGVAILVESQGSGRLALGADAILGQRQVVIKSFESNYRPILGIAAATILGDGRVALILDVDALIGLCRDNTGMSSEQLERKTGT